MGYIFRGEWAIGSPRIVVNKKKRDFRVSVLRVARPNATQYEIGSVFDKNGRAGSGIFINGELAYSCDLTNQAIAKDFESMNGKYRNNGYSEYFGELNPHN